MLQSIAVVGLVGGAVAYGMHRLDEGGFETGPRVALLQGDIDVRLHNQGVGQKMIEQYVGLLFLTRLHDRPVDLVVWPENAYPGWHYDIPPQLPLEEIDPAVKVHAARIQADLHDIATHISAEQLVGLTTVVVGEKKKETRYASALLLHKNGSLGERFDKIHRVPFGEYVPLRDWLPFMNALAPYKEDYSISAGSKYTRFPLGDRKFGTLICYEDTDPVPRPAVRP